MLSQQLISCIYLGYVIKELGTVWYTWIVNSFPLRNVALLGQKCKLRSTNIIITQYTIMIPTVSEIPQRRSVEINRILMERLNWLSYKSDCLKNKKREREAYIYISRMPNSAEPIITPEPKAFQIK
jgi:hypothetical protein